MQPPPALPNAVANAKAQGAQPGAAGAAAAAAPAPPPPPPPPAPTGEPPEIELIHEYSWRNFFTTINFLKVLQKMTKHRSHRTFMLQQYKSSVSALVLVSYMERLTRTANHEANVAGQSSNVAIAGVEIDQESDAVVWAEMATKLV